MITLRKPEPATSVLQGVDAQPLCNCQSSMLLREEILSKTERDISYSWFNHLKPCKTTNFENATTDKSIQRNELHSQN